MELWTRRIYEARREGLLARLEGERIPITVSVPLFDAWEEEADRRGLPRQDPGFWAQAPDWIRDEARGGAR